MKFLQYQDCKSPHQLPLSRELRRMLCDQYRYVYQDHDQANRASVGWKMSKKDEPWMAWFGDEGVKEKIENADVLLSMFRDVHLFEKRRKKGLLTFYHSERWFKPPFGLLRLFHPKYFRMAKRMVSLIRECASFVYLPIGIHAARDMARLCGLMNGDWKCLFCAPKLDFERKPGGRIWISGEPQNTQKYCLGKMRMWGYFVEEGLGVRGQELGGHLVISGQSLVDSEKECGSEGVKVLWVGRLLDLKRVDTIIKAVGACSKGKKITLDIYGLGPEDAKLKKLAAKYGDVIKFYPPVPIGEVRKLMREHDVYVLSSNGYEGWGAVVSEALEEGMAVIGTYEAGSSATILPKSNLFHAGDWRKLKMLLEGDVERVGIGSWTAKRAAEVLLRQRWDI